MYFGGLGDSQRAAHYISSSLEGSQQEWEASCKLDSDAAAAVAFVFSRAERRPCGPFWTPPACAPSPVTSAVTGFPVLVPLLVMMKRGD